MTHLARLVAAASLARARAHEEGADVVTGTGVLPGIVSVSGCFGR